jgi:MoxR-like ATPase
LPESQLDRFLMRIHLGYPSKDQEKALLAGEDRRKMLKAMDASIDLKTLLRCQMQAEKVRASEPVIEYCYRLLALSRSCGKFLHGLSPRAGLGLLHASRAWAMLEGRDYVIPEDVQAVAPACLSHRLLAADDNAPTGHSEIAEFLLRSVAVP